MASQVLAESLVEFQRDVLLIKKNKKMYDEIIKHHQSFFSSCQTELTNAVNIEDYEYAAKIKKVIEEEKKYMTIILEKTKVLNKLKIWWGKQIW